MLPLAHWLVGAPIESVIWRGSEKIRPHELLSADTTTLVEAAAGAKVAVRRETHAKAVAVEVAQGSSWLIELHDHGCKSRPCQWLSTSARAFKGSSPNSLRMHRVQSMSIFRGDDLKRRTSRDPLRPNPGPCDESTLLGDERDEGRMSATASEVRHAGLARTVELQLRAQE